MLYDLALVVDMFTSTIAETPCLVPEPAPGLLKGGDISDLLVRRSLRGESGRVLRIYEHATVVGIVHVSALIGRVAGMAPRAAGVARWVISVARGIAPSRI